MLILTYGFKKPQTGDAGSAFFPALEFDIQQLNDHTHDGVTSSKITTASVTPTTQAILSAAWVSLGGGNYRQQVTLPAGLTYDTVVPTFRNASTGHLYTLTVEKVSASAYYVYINDNTIALTAVYLT